MHPTGRVVALFCFVVACSQGPIGPQGPQGPPGPSGAPPTTYNVLDYGAKPNQSSFDNTSKFQSAIDATPGSPFSTPL
jgi:hypothetical protein